MPPDIRPEIRPGIRLDGRVAIVTGAGRGLGRAHALELARRGARVAVNDAGVGVEGEGADPAPAREAAQEVLAAGGEAIAHTGDIADPAQAAALVHAALDRWGRVDIVVNNAGNNRRATFSSIHPADLRAMLEVHVLGALHVTQAAWPDMAASRYGRVVLTTSQVGFYGKIDSAGYGIAKMALLGMLQAIRHEGEPLGIRANALAPFALTRMANQFPEPLRSVVPPERVSAGLAWLCSEACPLSGEILVACGGHFGIARILESRGIDIRDPALVTAENLQRHWAEVADMTNATTHPGGVAAVEWAIARLGGKPG